MRILQITPQMPYPPDSGGRVGILNSIIYLSRIHDITLLSFCTDETVQYVDDLKRFCRDVITVRHPSGSSYWDMAANLFSSMPYTIVRFRSAEMMNRVKELVGSGAFDLVHIDHLHMAQYVHGVPNEMPTVLREHNVESVIMRRFSERSSNPLKRKFAAIQANKLDGYESEVCALFTRTVPVTDVDGAALRRMSPHARVTVIPSGVDTELFRGGDESAPVQLQNIITTGDYGWPPTADGLHFLINDILPLIHARMAGVRLVIVGRNIPESIGNSANSASLDILGRVEDVRPEILKRAVFVVPTRIGSGIRLKILESMKQRQNA